ncbi:MAG TPA: VanZ family protein [Longimicrobiaceae bacterium]|nr:VanZ family protein [Longimicrobiaceae bacterium]
MTPRPPRAPTLALAASTLVILVATLTPTRPMPGPPLEGCWVCGAKGLADVIANVLLFTPLGAALFLRTRRVGWSLLFGALLSAGVELTQYHVPGRDPSLGDLLSNTLGTGLGVLVVASWPLWRAPGRRRWVAPLLATAVALGVLAGGSVLIVPALPAGPLVASWSPVRPDLYPYTGKVLRAGVGHLAPVPGPVRDPGLLRERFRDGAPVHVTAVAGPAPPGLSPLFTLQDSREVDVLLLGLDRRELVFRFRTRASALRLGTPDLRLAVPAAELRAGNRIDARARRTGRGYCLSLNRATDCSLGFTLGDTWSVLFYPGSLPPAEKLLLQLFWMAALFVPAGFWTRRRADALPFAALTVVALVGLPRLLPCEPTPPEQVAAALVGILAGMALARFVPGTEAPG